MLNKGVEGGRGQRWRDTLAKGWNGVVVVICRDKGSETEGSFGIWRQ